MPRILFTTTTCLSAFLLFLIQPQIGKEVLPLLGGSAAVWTTCLLFFQIALLIGYLYAHAIVSLVNTRTQVLLHLTALLGCAVSLPPHIPEQIGGLPDNPVLWLLGQLAVNIGLPFFIVSTSGPLLQRWASLSIPKWADNPYPLYSASNLGSFAALWFYPFVIERNLSLSTQSSTWAAGYLALAAMTTACGGVLLSAKRSSETIAPLSMSARPELTARTLLYWTFCAFVPSSLMSAATAHITTYIAAVPLIWVLPLGIYLMSFVIVFSRNVGLSQFVLRGTHRIFPYAAIVIVPFLYIETVAGRWVVILIHLAFLLVSSLLCHGALSSNRPPATSLTVFYLAIAIGGALGGVWNSLIAPILFSDLYEYPLAIVLSALLMSSAQRANVSWRDIGIPFALVAVVYPLAIVLDATSFRDSGRIALIFALPAVACFSFQRRALRFALGLAGLMFLLGRFVAENGATLRVYRNYFGVKRVVESTSPDFPPSHLLIHGGTTHGAELNDPSASCKPLTYFHQDGPAGDIFSLLPTGSVSRHFAIVGLGVGTLITYQKPEDKITFIEIDSQVKELAEDATLFRFLKQCGHGYQVILGDGRKTLEGFPDEEFQLIILDAFSSDAVPIHLLTAEALQLYLSKITTQGILVFNISNRHLDLKQVIARAAAEQGVFALVREDLNLSKQDRLEGRLESSWMVLAKDRSALSAFESTTRWKPLVASPTAPYWTDTYSSLAAVIRWR